MYLRLSAILKLLVHLVPDAEGRLRLNYGFILVSGPSGFFSRRPWLTSSSESCCGSHWTTRAFALHFDELLDVLVRIRESLPLQHNLRLLLLLDGCYALSDHERRLQVRS